MQLLIFVLFSFILTIKAQYLPIPCQSDNTCTSIIDPSREHICYKGICMCQNSTTKYYELCSRKDAIVGARPKGLRRSCEGEADCGHIEGATCTNSDGSDASSTASTKICDCLPHLVASADGQSCLEKVTDIGARCNETAQCAASLNAECVAEGRCRCGANYHYTVKNNRCTANKGYGDSCANEEESCYQLSDPHDTNALKCSNQVCKCLTNYRYQDGKCQYSAGSRTVYQVSLVAAMVIVIAKIF